MQKLITPHWVVFLHNDGQYEIYKGYDNAHIWVDKTEEVIDYFDNYFEAQACVKKCKADNLDANAWEKKIAD
jgi:hypothetical protein